MNHLQRRIALVLTLISACGSCSEPPATVKSQPVLAAAAEPIPLPMIELRGSAVEIGASHGRQLGSAVRSLSSTYLERFFRSDRDKALALFAAGAFAPHIAPEHRDEIAAMAGAASIEPGMAMLAQCFLDLSSMTACSGIALPASASPDGVPRLGRNLDFPSFDIADKHSVLLIYHPDGGRYGFAAVGWPGLVGVLSGMNEHGLALSNMEVTRARRAPTAMPYTLLYRTVLERCRSVTEAIDLLQRTPRQTANNLILIDAAGDRAVVELTPEKIQVRRASADQALIATNHQRGDDAGSPGQCPRYDALHESSARRHGDIDRSAVEDMLAGVSQGSMTLQSMVFEPGIRTLHLATGENAPQRSYHRIDLRMLFTRPMASR
jgi:predicted choloylglycine hydrolase